MPSQIVVTVPVSGNPTTASVRSNFQIAASEITALQATPPGSGIGTVNAGPGLSGGGSTTSVTLSLATPVSVANGGTGAAALSQYGALLGNGTSAVAAAAPGAVGTVLTSNGAAANPTFQPPATGGGTVGNATAGQMAQYTGVNVVGGATISGDATIAAGGALTLASVVTGATFAYPTSLTVDAKGRITAATAGVAPPTPGPAGSVLGSNGTVAAYTRDLTSLNTVTVNQNTGALPAPYSGTLVRAAGVDTQNARVEIDCFSTGTANSPQLSLRRSSGTAAAQLPPFLNAILGYINFAGYTVTPGYQQSAGIIARAAELWNDNAQGSQLEFSTTTLNTQVGATNPTRMTIGQGVVVGGATGGATTIVGDMGPGTVNVPATGGYYVNGQPLSTGGGADTVTRNIAAAATAPWAALPSAFNEVTTVAAVGNGCALPAGTVGQICKVRNSGANPLAVYPAATAAINALAVGASITVPVDTTAYFEAVAATQWYTVP
jgi:hypothetical protein